MKNSTKLFIATYIVLGIAYVVSLSFTANLMVKAALKVLPLMLLLGMMLKASPKEPLMISGLIASMAGDVVVFWGGMIPQIAFFVAAQILYMAAFSKFFKPEKHTQWYLAFTLVILVSLMGTSILTGAINNKVGAPLMIALGLYMVVIFCMAFFAVSQTRNMYYIYVAGAFLFILSDGMIAVDNFVYDIHHSSYLVMPTYYMAQLLLCYNTATRRE